MKTPHWILYGISLIFIASGAFNYGFSRFFLALPFVVVACIVTWRYPARKILFVVTVLFVLLAISFNLTLEKNPLVFPILNDGYIEIKKDGCYKVFGDGSGGYFNESSCPAIGSPLNVKAGATFKVAEVRMVGEDLGSKVTLITESRQMISPDPNSLNTSQPIESPYFKHFGDLMLWPLPLILVYNSASQR